MKSTLLYKKNFFAVLVSFILSASLLVACDKDNNDDNDRMYTTTATASGSQQNPPVSSTGTSTLVGTYNSNTNEWQYSINWTGLAAGATVIEFRGPADVGVNGNLLFSLTITGGGTNGATSNTITLTADQEAHLLANKMYYTILNATHVTGELRGQISVAQQ